MNCCYTNKISCTGNSDDMPEYVKYFQEINLVEIVELPCDKPDIDSLSSVMIAPKVLSSKLITTPIALSYEGQNLSGYKLVVQLSLDEKIKYVTTQCNHSVHATHFTNILKSVFVVVPSEVNGVPVCDLVRTNKYAVTPYVEDIYAVRKDCRTLYKCSIILVDVKFFT